MSLQMISAVVLAAGKGTRLEGCKQLVRVGGKPLLEHALDNLRASKIDEIVVILGAYADEIKRQVRFDRERVVINPDYSAGIATSIQTGLRAIDAEAVLMVLADQPYVAPQTIDLLIAEYRRTQASIVIPTYNGLRGNPVLVDKALFPELMNLRGDIGCRAIFDGHAGAMMKVPVNDHGILIDIDTREDVTRSVGDGPACPGGCTDLL
jgi:molybdenum cofactor cytidylyltransferase